MTAATLVSLFLALVGWFQVVQPYDAYALAAQPYQLTLYHVARVLFAVFWAILVYGYGKKVSSLMGLGRALLPLSSSDRTILCLIMGLAVLRPLILFLGIFHLFHPLVFAGIGAVGILWSQSKTLADLLPCKPTWSSTNERSWGHIMAACTALIVIALLASKIFFPLTDPDYLNHYLNYYVRVVQDGHLWPDNAWPHFYSSKGGSEVFLAVGLSDALAPLTVSGLMLCLCLGLCYSMVHHGTQDRLAAFLACILAAAAFMHVSPGTAEFCKQHIIGGALLLGLAWSSQHSIRSTDHGREWRIIILLQAIMIPVFRPTFGLIALGFFAIISLLMLLRRDRGGFHTHFLAALATVVSAMLVLLFNQLTTGLADTTPFRLFAHLANYDKLSQWLSPFWLVVLDLGSPLTYGHVTIPGLSRLSAAAQITRLPEFAAFMAFPPVLPAIMIAALACYRKGQRATHFNITPATCLIALLVSAFTAALFIQQDISLKRAYIFCSFVIAALGAMVLGWARGVTLHGKNIWQHIGAVMMCIMAVLVCMNALSDLPNRHKRDIAQLAGGHLTLGQIYTRDYPNWPAYAAACRALPPHSRVWTSRYMPTPGCKAENFFYFTMGKDWHRVLFEPADIAKRALQEAGLNYFLIDTSEPFFDLLPYAPLFQPHSIPQSFRIVFRQGDVYVLGWKNDEDDSASHNVLAQEFIPAYANSVHLALRAADFPGIYGQMLHYYQLYRERGHGPVVLDPALPRPRGWQ